MKLKTLIATVLLLNAILSNAEATTVSQKPPIKLGSWLFKFYQHGGTTESFSAAYCVSDGSWITNGPVSSNSSTGRWSVNGSTIFFNGIMGSFDQGGTISYIGSIVHSNLITGHYQTFNILDSFPNGSAGSFSASYEAGVCAY